MRNSQSNKRDKVFNLARLPQIRPRSKIYTEESSVSANSLTQKGHIIENIEEEAVGLAEGRGAGTQYPHLPSVCPSHQLSHGGHQRNNRRTVLGNIYLSLKLGLWRLHSVTITIMPPQRGLWKALVATGMPSLSCMYRGEWASSGT